MRKTLAVCLSLVLLISSLGCTPEDNRAASPSPDPVETVEPAPTESIGQTASAQTPEVPTETAEIPSTETMGQADNGDSPGEEPWADIELPRESLWSYPDPEKEYGLSFYVGTARLSMLNYLAWSVAPAGTEDWVYIDCGRPDGAKACTFYSNDYSEVQNSPHGCHYVYKYFADIDGSISDQWRIRVEFLPFAEVIEYFGGQYYYFSYIWEDVAITGDDTFVRLNLDADYPVGSTSTLVGNMILTLTPAVDAVPDMLENWTALEIMPMTFCENCPERWTTEGPWPNIELPRESLVSYSDPEKEYGFTFYLGLGTPNQSIFDLLVWSVAPAGTEDWVYLDRDPSSCYFPTGDDQLSYRDSAHGSTSVCKLVADIDGSISDQWRIRVEFLPFDIVLLMYDDRYRYFSYIWEDITITGTDTFVKFDQDFDYTADSALDTLENRFKMELLTMTFCENCPEEWKAW